VKLNIAFFGALLFATTAGCGTTTAERLQLGELPTVPQVDVARYLGTWYEIASYPQSFQKGCTATTATYSLRDDGELDVLNRCRKPDINGEEDSAHGHAWIVDKRSNAKLEVSFFWPFHGAYWIIDLGKNYEYAVVGHPSRDYLWILSRKPKLDPALYEQILERLEKHGYDRKRLVVTPQRP